MSPRIGPVVVALAWGAAVTPACGGQSELVIGGDPATGGGLPAPTGGVPTGGASGSFPIGGTSGTFPVGGMSSSDTGGTAYGGSSTYGGSFGVGGSATYGGSFGVGGSAPLGGTAGVVAGGSQGVGGTPADPYPPVFWAEGQGYRATCPAHGEFWGFTCWNDAGGGSRACSDLGDPYCNACLCVVPCGMDGSCPSSVTGGRADCIASAIAMQACFPVCDVDVCPSGMTCTQLPGTARAVCMWVDDQRGD